MPTLVWQGKSAVIDYVSRIDCRRLRCDPALSFGPSESGNLLIEGDNLEALQALRPDYRSSVKCAFIDPPYNTGNEAWSYNDNANDAGFLAWLETVSGESAAGWSRHDRWLCLMYPRIRLLRDLLAEDGVLWVAIDDNEQHHLRLLLDEVFGEANFVGAVVWERSDAPKAAADHFAIQHDYLLCYARDIAAFELRAEHPGAAGLEHDELGRTYYLRPLRALGGNGDPQGDVTVRHPHGYFGIPDPAGNLVFPTRFDGSRGAWRWPQDRVGREAGRLEWREAEGRWEPYYRVYSDRAPAQPPPETLWSHGICGSNRSAYRDLKRLFDGERVFETPKPEQLLARILEISTEPGDLVLDVFAGLGATGAVAHKLGRRYILAEMTPRSCKRIAERLSKVAAGQDPGGVTSAASWSGGGGLRYMRLGEQAPRDGATQETAMA